MPRQKVFAINLPKRADRRIHIKKQFSKKKEFLLSIVEPVKDNNGAKSLWKTIKQIIVKNFDDEFVIICEDDHEFTAHYSPQKLCGLISEADSLNADVLAGGVSWVQVLLPAGDSLYWIDRFTGTQLIIIFKRFYNKILNSKYKRHDTADSKICTLSENKFVVFPFMSIQKDFGYSDATIFNNKKGQVKKLFLQSSQSFKIVNHVAKYYSPIGKPIIGHTDIANITIPTYVINLPERKDRLSHIKEQFLNKPEFDVKIIMACKNKIGALGLWKSIRKVIELAIKNDDDVIAIVEDDHNFTRHYSKEFFLRNVIEAHQQNVDYLSGGTSGFNHTMQVANNRFWLHPCLSTQFIVIYKKFFRKIMDEPFDKDIIADVKFSEMTSNKMTLFPFISIQKDFRYSDVTPIHNEIPGIVDKMFFRTQKRLRKIKEATSRFKGVIHER